MPKLAVTDFDTSSLLRIFGPTSEDVLLSMPFEIAASPSLAIQLATAAKSFSANILSPEKYMESLITIG